MRILLGVGEEQALTWLRSALLRALVAAEPAVETASDRDDIVQKAATGAYDAIVLRQALPEADGLKMCRRLRAADVWTPTIVLVEGEANDRIAAFDSGADDCLSDPVAMPELAARIRSLVRRGSRMQPLVLELGDLRLERIAR